MRIVTNTTMPWRIVIGRLGRLGHGELKSIVKFIKIKKIFFMVFLFRLGNNFIKKESCSLCIINT
jgi:hypothetical protein